jgi:hypothetical protein
MAFYLLAVSFAVKNCLIIISESHKCLPPHSYMAES